MPRSWIRMILLLGAILLLSASPAASDDDGDYSRSGAYVRGGLGAAWISSSTSFPSAPSQSWVANPEMQLSLGWRQNERLALEAEFQWVPSHEGIGYGSWLLGANGKFFLLEGRVQPYLLLGAYGYWAKPPGASESQVDWGFKNGAGFDYYLNEDWAVGVESSFIWGVGKVWRNYFLTTSVTTTYRF